MKFSQPVITNINLAVENIDEVNEFIKLNKFDDANSSLNKLTGKLDDLKKYSDILFKITSPAALGIVGHVERLEVPLDDLLEYESTLDKIDKKLTALIEKNQKLKGQNTC